MGIDGVAARACGVTLHVRLTSKGGRNAIEGWAADASGKRHLKARVSAPPEDGKANAALRELLAHAFGVGKRSVRIAAGDTSRIKRVEIDGDAGALMARLNQWGPAK